MIPDHWTCKACAGDELWSSLKGAASAVKGWCGHGQHHTPHPLRYVGAAAGAARPAVPDPLAEILAAAPASTAAPGDPPLPSVREMLAATEPPKARKPRKTKPVQLEMF